MKMTEMLSFKLSKLTAVLCAAMLLAPCAAQNRVALVVGISEYPDGGAVEDLGCAVNDAKLIGAELKQCGFTVIEAVDANKSTLDEKIDLFFSQITDGGDAVFYFAGHGVQWDGKNYLLAANAKFQQRYRLSEETVDAQTILQAMEDKKPKNALAFLDCCRTAPSTSWLNSPDVRQRSAGKITGLAAMQARNVLINFAAAANQESLEPTNGKNSIYAEALAKGIRSGKELSDIIKDVTREVITESKRITQDQMIQQPYISGSLLGDFWFAKNAGNEAREMKPNAPPVGVTPRTASKETPFENSLEMKFVPIGITTGGKDVLFSVWETRRQDYDIYAKANNGVDDKWKNVEYEGEKVGHEPDHPVVCVSHDDAVKFCQWLTKKEQASGKIGPNDEYRLPTDAEWSYAVGLGKKEDASASPKDKIMQIDKEYPWGSGVSYEDLKKVPSGAGNYDSYSSSKISDDRYDRTSPVGSFSANPFGIYDLGGNVWEWCGSYYDGSSGARVLRGGSWHDDAPGLLLSSFRFFSTSVIRRSDVGFRCVLVVSAR